MDVVGIIEDTRARLKKRIQGHEQYLGSGKAKSFEDYKRVSGLIEGIREAESDFNEIVKNYLREEFDE